MAHLVHNERAKLVANALDRASTGCFATGILVPTAGVMLGQPLSMPFEVFFKALPCWLFATIVLHIEARRVIETLRE